LHSANVYWFDMDEIDHDEFRPAMAANHRNQYGLCEYYWACLEAHLDEEQMSHKYVKVERRREGAV
jgi:hypothetical protein